MDSQPLRETNIYMFHYFVLFIIFGVFLCANLLIGILVKHILTTGILSDKFDSTKKSKSVPHANRSNSNETDQDNTVHFYFIKIFLIKIFGINSIKEL